VASEGPVLSSDRPDRRALLAMGIVVLVWGSAFPAIGAAVLHYEPGQLVLLRFLVASTVLGARALAIRQPLPQRQDLVMIGLAALAGVVGYQVPLSYGQRVVSAGAASLLINTSPIFTVLLAAIFLRERMSPAGWVGVGISFAGACVVSVAASASLRLEPAALLVIFAAAAGAVYTVLQKPLLTRYTPLQYTSYIVWTGAALLLVFAPGLLTAVRDAPRSATYAVVYLGLSPSIAGYALFTYGLSRLPASRVSVFIYLIPVCALAIAWVWLGEVPGWLTVAGGAVSVAGVVVVNVWGAPGSVAADG
jgi:drug/metabolite transporter (DMT)-like permease